MKVADRRDRTRNLSLRKRCTNHCTTRDPTQVPYENLWLNSNCSSRNFVPVGTISSEQTHFFFLSDKCELTAGSDEKKKQRSPAVDRTLVFCWSLCVCRLEDAGHFVVKKNWQLGERQKFARRSCRGFVAVVRASDRQLEYPGSITGGAALCFLFFRLNQLSLRLVRWKKKGVCLTLNENDKLQTTLWHFLTQKFSGLSHQEKSKTKTKDRNNDSFIIYTGEKWGDKITRGR